MMRREFIAGLGSAAAWPVVARAQQTKIWRIGMLDTAPQEQNAANLAAFRQRLRELGYVEGQNLAIEYRWAEGRSDRLPELVSELLRLKVDALVVRGTQEAVAVKNATTTVPVIMSAVADPVRSGLATRLARPGGNFTGMVSFASELAGKNVELLRAMVPTIKLLASLRDASNPAAAMQWEGIQKAGRLLGIETRSFDVQNAADVSRAFDVASRDRVDAIYVNVDSVNRANQLQIIGLATQHKLPPIYSAREFVERGGLATYAVSYPQLYSRTADLADKIFKGTNPADIFVNPLGVKGVGKATVGLSAGRHQRHLPTPHTSPKNWDPSSNLSDQVRLL
jgi:putative tryptophan/tyrosine transport system substrate-binding protein